MLAGFFILRILATAVYQQQSLNTLTTKKTLAKDAKNSLCNFA